MYSDERKQSIAEMIKAMTDNELFRGRANTKDAIVLDRENLEENEWTLLQLNAEVDRRVITKAECEPCLQK